MRHMRGLTAAAAVALALAVGGCSTGGAAVPDDWVEFDGDGFTVAHPPDWREAPEVSGEITELAVEGERAGDSLPPVLTVDVDPGPSAEATTAEQPMLDYINTQTINIEDYEVTRGGGFDVPGAASAHRLSQRYTSTREGSEDEPLREESVIAVGEDQLLVLLHVGVGEEGWDEFADTAEAIIASLTLDP